MKKASIDLGTNTCLLLIMDGATVLHDESQVVRLGHGVDKSGELRADAIERALVCLKKYSEIASRFGVQPQHVVAVATAQARDAKNAAEFFAAVQNATGFMFRTLTGDEEARASFLGAKLPEVTFQQMVVMDIGGGSTELVSEQGGKSLQIGAVRMTERYLKSDPVTDPEFWACENAIDVVLRSEMQDLVTSWHKNQGDLQLVAVAGTAVTLAMLNLGMGAYDRAQIDSLLLSRGDVHRWVEEFKFRTIEERSKLTGMDPKRADVILAGALIFWRVMEVLDFKSARISTRGLRYGVLN